MGYKKKTFEPSANAKAAKAKIASPPCQHKNLMVLETRFAKVTYPNGYKAMPHYNYDSNIMGANISRVKTYYCVDCDKEILAPKRKE